jgi:nondiscriminating glutamyl-tRNA synthetase
MKNLDLSQVVELSLPHLISAGKLDEKMSDEQREWASRVISLYQEQMSFGAEIVELSEMFFKTDLEYDEDAKAVLEEEQVPEVLQAFLNEIEALENYEAAEIKSSIKAVQKSTGHKGKKLFMPIRVAVTGQTHGPELPNAIELLGKNTVKHRLQSLLG